jgi:hypothetical protein
VEEAAAVRWAAGRTGEVGGGSHPTPGATVVVDRTPGGTPGTAGCESGAVSRANVCGDMAALPLRTGSLDTLVARHVLEHHADTAGVLREWARVARRLVVVCPDEETHGATLALDPTHVVALARGDVAGLLEGMGMRVLAAEACVPGWSFLVVGEA